MPTRTIPSIFITILALLLLAACARDTPPPETPALEPAYTAAAQTVMARLTLEAGQTAVAQLTRMALESTPSPTFQLPTLPPASPTSQPTATPTTTSTPVPASATPTATPVTALCDRAEFVMNMSLSDGARLVPGADFTKTWRIENVGDCTWGSGYSLVFLEGAPMGGDMVVPLPTTVRPGEVVDLSIFLKAPDLPGEYLGSWMLRNNFGDLFGIGPGADIPLQVFIEVIRYDRDQDYAYDFAANYCSASWLSAEGAQTCSGSSRASGGSAILLLDPDLETRPENELTLWLRPNQAPEGWFSGQYPPYRVRDGDHFMAEIGCLNDSPDCDVAFQLNYRAGGGPLRRLGSWRETYDGDATEINIDLSFLAGEGVRFLLEIFNNGDSQDANAFWFVPHIRNLEAEADRVLEWQESGGRIGACNELIIYLISGEGGEAQAYSCEGERNYLGNIGLTNDEVRQLSRWVERLSYYEAQVSRPSSGDPEITRIIFQGQGSEEATQGTINDMRSLAARLFTLINQ